MFDVATQDELETFFRISGPVNADESPLERILKSPATLVGISDGGAHLQTFAGGDYTSYFLEHWVREKGSFSLEEGVAALSSRVADFLGLGDRGTLEEGKAADVVIFDPDTVGPLTLQTLEDIPGGGTRMTKDARYPLGDRQRRAGDRRRCAHRRRPRPVMRKRRGASSRVCPTGDFHRWTKGRAQPTLLSCRGPLQRRCAERCSCPCIVSICSVTTSASVSLVMPSFCMIAIRRT